jgi:hypothetical protein
MRRLAFVSGLVVALLAPAVARAEVSVQVNGDGQVTRVVVLAKGGRIWRQVRGHVPAAQLLNPLGDTYGDLAPVIATHPKSGQPWAVWPQNDGNRKRLVISSWNGTAWTDPVRIARSDLMGYDQIEPRLLFDASGVPYVFYTEGAHQRRVLFVTPVRGVWSPPLRLSEVDVDSRAPSVLLSGDDIQISYQTSAGTVSRTVATTFLELTATNLMDSPIPPGYAPVPPPPGGNPKDEPGDQHVFRR